MSRWLYGEPVPTGGRRPGLFGPKLYRFKMGGAFEIGPPGSGWIVTIPSDFIFDLSAPWWIAWALPRSRMLRTSGLHDRGRDDPTWSLWFSDLIFADSLRADGVKDPMLTVCWWAVRTNNNRG